MLSKHFSILKRNPLQFSKQFYSSSRVANSINIKKGHNSTIRHLHFPKIIKYEKGLEIQEQFVRANLDFKKIQSKVINQIHKVESGQTDTSEVNNDQEAQVSDYERQFLSKMLKDMKPSPLILTFQFQPVYTGGKREKVNKLEEESKYNHKDAYYIQSNRGGQVTFHGPGQMVGYSIIDLHDFTNKPINFVDDSNFLMKKSNKALSPRCFVNGLEESIIQTLHYGHPNDNSSSLFNIISKRTENTGVWITDNTKIASIGVQVRRGITSHGVAINVSTDLSYPNHVTMCGLENTKTVSANSITGKSFDVKDMSYSYAREFAKVFGFQYLEHFEVDGETFGTEKTQYENGFKETLY